MTDKIVVQLVRTECAVCGVSFAVPEAVLKQRQQDGKVFYCPSGHTLSFGNSELDKARAAFRAQQKETDRLKQSLDHERHLRTMAERSRSYAKGQVTKARNRLRSGQCPFCGQAFDSIADHMREHHPEIEA